MYVFFKFIYDRLYSTKMENLQDTRSGLGEAKFIGQAYFRNRSTSYIHGGTQAEVRGAGRKFYWLCSNNI